MFEAQNIRDIRVFPELEIPAIKARTCLRNRIVLKLRRIIDWTKKVSTKIIKSCMGETFWEKKLPLLCTRVLPDRSNTFTLRVKLSGEDQPLVLVPIVFLDITNQVILSKSLHDDDESSFIKI